MAGDGGDEFEDRDDNDEDDEDDDETEESEMIFLSGGGAITGAWSRVWRLLAGCEGGISEMSPPLGHAVAAGLPWVRTWACSLVVWKASRRNSPSLPQGRISHSHAFAPRLIGCQRTPRRVRDAG